MPIQLQAVNAIAESPAPAAVFDALNPEQRAAVQHGDEPLVVVAGAGSGKTAMLAARVARLVLDGADPRRILLMTFSRRAAAEMQRRAGRLLQRALGLPATARPPELPWCGTFHSVGARLLREHAAALGLTNDFNVIDRADAEELLAQTRTRLDLHAAEQRFPLARTAQAILSRTVNSAQPLAAVLAQHFPWCAESQDGLRRLFAAYTEAKQAQRLLDYDDLLLYWRLALQEGAIAHAMGRRFDHVLVDEMQDTNQLQADILLALKPDGRGLTVVGDDAQAIYGFRAADVAHLLDLPQRFTPPARVLLLEHNYRSTQPLLAAANAVIEQAGRRFAKTLWSERASSHKPQLVHVADEAAQAAWVADTVLRQREQGTPLTRQAVLFRTGHHSAALELELTRRRIPFVKYGGLRFLEAAHVRDLLALLRWTHNLRSRLAGLRVLRLVSGIGPAAALQVLDRMDAGADPAAALLAWAPPRRAATDWAAFIDTCRALIEPDAAWPAAMAPAQRWLQAQLPRLYGDDAPVRSGDLDQLGRLAGAHGSRERFLTELALDPPAASSDESGPPHRDEDYLILSTIHAAKGQEWHSVHLLNVVDGCMPADVATGSPTEIDEERRLLYVAMTRARERLHLLLPQRFYVTQQRSRGDRHLYAGRSRFIPPALDPLFEPVAPMAAGDANEQMDELPMPAIDLAARLRRSGGLP
ncbi:MAG: ATP-dependent helicase [Proteobacteria bacterium]|nr:ATP-dependent helicase [Pseudomonadota bacterium]